MNKTKWGLLFFICLIFIGCAAPDNTPSGTIKIFCNAVFEGDLETFSKYANFDTGRADNWLYFAQNILDGKGEIKNISETSNDGNNAVVKVTFEHGSYDFRLVNISGKWKIPFSSPF